MRILSIRFKNLNSLVGKWAIDFTVPAYDGDGIFAITGPTGAGKTTILDAICLALYGKTPRLGKITKNSNEIMSRYTYDSSAEIEFETIKGRFRCHWNQRRAHNKSSGELQSPKHEISNATTNEVIESKLKDVAQRVEEVTGMDFDRFTRSMLLAQGGFAAFLQAKPDERAPILERITGTEIYSQISMKVHKRKSDENKKLEALKTELDGIQLMSEMDKTKLKINLENKKSEENDLSKELNIARDAMALNKSILQAEKKRENYRSKIDKANNAIADFMKSLENIQTFLDIHSVDENLIENLTGINQQFKTLEEIEKKYSKKQKAQNKSVADIKQTIQALNEEKNTRKIALKCVDDAQTQLTQLQNDIKKLLDGCDILTWRDEIESLKQRQQCLKQTEKTLDRIEITNKKIEKLKKKNEFFVGKQKEFADKHNCLVEKQKLCEHSVRHLEEKATLLNRIRSLEEERAHLIDGKPCPLCGAIKHPYANGNIPNIETKNIENAKIKLQSVTKQLGNLQIEKATTAKDIEQIDYNLSDNKLLLDDDKKQCNKLLGELKISVESEKLSDIICGKLFSIEDKLKKHCKIVKQANKKNNEEKQERELLSVMRERLIKNEKSEQEAIYENKNAENKSNRLICECETLAEELKEACKKTFEHIQIYGIKEFAPNQADGILNELTERRNVWKQKQNKKINEEKKIAELSSEKETQNALLESLNDEIKKQCNEHKDLAKQLNILAHQREAEHGSKNFDIEFLETNLKELQQKIGAIKQSLLENAKLCEKQKNNLQNIEKQKNECDRWNQLHELIGSADGKKFRNFAQGLTFERMVDHTNRQLQKMNDRYILIRDDVQPLELNVVDSYQADGIRSVKNLSGGESFIVSLSLALGLSRMSSRNVRINSLFLDEGFSALDENSLETVLETLAELRQSDKLIGIISHIPALRERIITQIRVHMDTNGQSRLKGPGCKAISI